MASRFADKSIGEHDWHSQEYVDEWIARDVTRDDYSEPMFEHARKRQAVLGANVSYVLADLRDPAWTARVGGPFDLTVSGLAIHNLGIESLMRACYRSIHSLQRPGSSLLLDYDLFGLVPGGVGTRTRWLLEAGFDRVECTWEEAPLAILAVSVGTKQMRIVSTE